MTIPIYVEPTKNGFRASTGSPLLLTAEASTADLAVSSLQLMYRDKINSGGEIRELNISGLYGVKSKINAIKTAAKAMSETAFIHEWQAAREAYRQSQDQLG